MILSSYLRELSVESNKRRNNNKELLNLVPNIDFYSTSKRAFIEKKELPKKEIKMKKKKGLMEIIDDKKQEEVVEKQEEVVEKQEEVVEKQEEVDEKQEEDKKDDVDSNEETPVIKEQNAGSDNIKRIFIKEPQEGGEPPPKDNQVKNITVTSFF